MKIAVVGSRSFKDSNYLRSILDEYYPNIKLIVSGGAKGADQLSEIYAKEEGIETLIFRPEWDKYGKSAGMIRNKDIVSNADIIIAFWDGKSSGTKSSIEFAKSLNKEVKIFYF